SGTGAPSETMPRAFTRSAPWTSHLPAKLRSASARAARGAPVFSLASPKRSATSQPERLENTAPSFARHSWSGERATGLKIGGLGIVGVGMVGALWLAATGNLRIWL